MSHWEQPPYMGACTGCAWTCEAITAGTLDVALGEHSRVWGHHLFAISQAEDGLQQVRPGAGTPGLI